MTVALQYDLGDLQKAADYLNKVVNFDRRRLLDSIGAVAESQTRRRIEEQLGAPDGTPWVDWSEKYAATRHSGQGFLYAEGDLADSIDHQVVSNDQVEVGSNLIYAATHQFGDEDRGIPARPYLGLSADDEDELLDTLNAFFAELL